MTRIVALSLSLLLLAGGAGAAKDRLQELLWDFELVPLDGASPPAFTLESLDGTTVSLAQFRGRPVLDRKSTRLNSSHGYISYAVFCLKKKKQKAQTVVGSHEGQHTQ